MTIWVAGFLYFISWVWLFLSIKENDNPSFGSRDMRTAGYNADDVTVLLFVMLLLVCVGPVGL